MYTNAIRRISPLFLICAAALVVRLLYIRETVATIYTADSAGYFGVGAVV